jgi:hypothetical protein
MSGDPSSSVVSCHVMSWYSHLMCWCMSGDPSSTVLLHDYQMNTELNILSQTPYEHLHDSSPSSDSLS